MNQEFKNLRRKVAIFLILTTIFEFSNIGADLLRETGETLREPALTQLAEEAKIPQAEAAAGLFFLRSAHAM